MELVYIGVAILLFFWFIDAKSIRIEWKNVGGFLGFMATLTCYRLSMFDMDFSSGAGLPSVPIELLEQPLWTFMLVFWEDVIFSMPIYVIIKRGWPKWITAIIVILLSISFGMGHAYQGLYGIMITSLYPFFISYFFNFTRRSC